MINPSTIEKILERARLAQGATKEERLAAAKKRSEEFNQKIIEQYRCGECGADTINYSHSFSCRWRGWA